MSHLFLLLFFLLARLTYLLGFIGEYARITCYEALSCAKFMCPMSNLLSSITGKGGGEFPLGEVGRRNSMTQCDPCSPEFFTDTAAATDFSRLG
jgi:hypothetical protein